MWWLIWAFLAVNGLMMTDALLRQRRIKRELCEKQAKLAEARAQLNALEHLNTEDRAWLAGCDAMTEQPWPLPTVGSFWEWQLGIPMGREVVEVTGTSLAPLAVRIKGSSDEREVSLDEFSRNAVPAPLGRRKR